MTVRNQAAGALRTRRQNASTPPRNDTVQSLSRALGLLNLIAQNDPGLTLSEVAQQSGLPISTVHRLLGTMQNENFVRFDSERGLWIIGVQSFIVGSAFLRSRELTAIARPFMRDLMERSGETVNLAIEDHGEAIYIAQVECRKMMRAIARPGGRASLHASGVGKALLAAMSTEQAAPVFAQQRLPQETEKTITDPKALRAEIEATRKRGFSIDEEENALGLRCVAAAIFDENRQPIAALSLSGPAVRVRRDLVAKFGNAVSETANKITERFGGLQPNT
jgi:IclR family acetate operon transcriptional repressor